MAIGKVEICGVDTSTLPVITNERMRELYPLVHSGDKEAREEFIRGNLRLVLSILQRFHHRCENVVSARQQCHPRQPLHPRHRLQGARRPGQAAKGNGA